MESGPGRLLALWAVLTIAAMPMANGLGNDLHQRMSRPMRSIRHPDAFTHVADSADNEGENHNSLTPAAGSQLHSVRVGRHGSSSVAVYQTKLSRADIITQTIITVHGRNRDAGHYWSTFNNVVRKAQKDNVIGAEESVMVVAPKFFSAKYNYGQYGSQQLAWGDLNSWEAGEAAVHPTNTSISSIDVLDALVGEYSNRELYPKLKNITVVGHGGGGQLIQRYAMLGVAPPMHVHVRYIHGDPSSCAYFTDDRPTSDEEKRPTAGDCPLYNDWRYGFHNFPGTSGGISDPQVFFMRYITRDVISIIGFQDVSTAKGDQTCMARRQGGSKRRDRNLTWYRYVNTLARTNETLHGFPGLFRNLPDWSHLSQGRTNLRLCIVEGASHSARSVFEGKPGLAALFDREIGSLQTVQGKN